MTEHIRQQVSLFVDDELTSDECEFFVRRLQRDPESRNLYMRYQLIGSALRGEHINANHAMLRERLQQALADPAEGERQSSGLPTRLAKFAAGAGIAASVAAAALLLVRPGTEPGSAASQPDVRVADQELAPVEPPSYVVPLSVPETPVTRPEVRLTGLQYLIYHGGHASGLNRTVVHTNVLAADSQDIVDAADAAAPEGADP